MGEGEGDERTSDTHKHARLCEEVIVPLRLGMVPKNAEMSKENYLHVASQRGNFHFVVFHLNHLPLVLSAMSLILPAERSASSVLVSTLDKAF